jgi:hypothetical protein
MSVQVDPMAASVVAAALSGTYPTLLPQWYLPPREAPLVGVQAHQDTAPAADQPLDLSAKPRNSQVSERRANRSLSVRARIRARSLVLGFLSFCLVLKRFRLAQRPFATFATFARRRINEGRTVVTFDTVTVYYRSLRRCDMNCRSEI